MFTGGSLLYGSTGRPDLLGAAHAAELARAQHASARRPAESLPDEAAVYPTHGFGSFCSATQAQGSSSTIGREKRVNPALTADEESYVTRLLAGLDAYPAYYAHMAPANAAGPAGPDCPSADLPRAASAPLRKHRAALRGSQLIPASQLKGPTQQPWPSSGTPEGDAWLGEPFLLSRRTATAAQDAQCREDGYPSASHRADWPRIVITASEVARGRYW